MFDVRVEQEWEKYLVIRCTIKLVDYSRGLLEKLIR